MTSNNRFKSEKIGGVGDQERAVLLAKKAWGPLLARAPLPVLFARSGRGISSVFIMDIWSNECLSQLSEKLEQL